MPKPPKSPPSISIWSDPKDRIDSQYGRLSYAEWCEEDAARINATGGSNGAAVSVGHWDGKIAIVRN